MKKYHNFICRLIDVTAGPFSIFVFSFSVICYLSLGLAGMSPEGHLIFTIEMIKISMLEIVFNISAAMVFSSLLYFALSYLCLSIFAQSLDMDELEYVNKQMEIVFEEMKSNSYCADTVVSNMNNMEKFAHNIFSFFCNIF